jgi:hypothetical protein
MNSLRIAGGDPFLAKRNRGASRKLGGGLINDKIMQPSILKARDISGNTHSIFSV